MIELPSSDVGDLERLADWLELCTLVDGEVSASAVAEVLQSSALAGYDQSEFFQGDETFQDPDAFSEQDAAERLTEMLWEQCRGRAQLLGDAYPFDLGREMASLRPDHRNDVPGYLMLLLIDIGFYYNLGDLLAPSSDSSRLFEKIVEASHRGMLGGPCSRFGWPREPDWPTAIDDRIRRLGQELDLTTDNLTDKTDPNDKDRGLDVAGRARMYDDQHGSYALLTQCATGRTNWKDKKGEPSLTAWANIFQWNALLMRAVALPWRLTTGWDRKRTHQYFEAIVLDRPRLLDGNPDAFLSDDLKTQINAWCDPVVARLPVLT